MKHSWFRAKNKCNSLQTLSVSHQNTGDSACFMKPEIELLAKAETLFFLM